MARILWDQTGERIYEFGLDRGVFYPLEGVGVAWNGLRSVTEKSSVKLKPLYFEGVKFADVATYEEFGASIEAITYPEEFLPYEGISEVTDGMYLADQPRKRFGLSYRTLIGDDLTDNRGYKIHVLYNLFAMPEDVSNVSAGSLNEPLTFRWNVTGIPIEIPGFSPTTHVIFDSRKMDPFMLEDIEAILYGDDNNAPRLPSIDELASFLTRWARFIVIDFGDGTWSGTSTIDGQITTPTPDTFQITDVPGVMINAYTYEIESSPRDLGGL